MFKTSLIRIIRSFSKKEMKEFGEFVNSPYFNKNENVKKLFDYLKINHDRLTGENTLKEKVFRKVFKKDKYDDGCMRSLIFSLTSLAEEFMVHENIRNNFAQKSIVLLEELNNRQLEAEIKTALKKSLKEINKLNPEDPQYSFYRFFYQISLNDFINWNRYGRKNITDNYEHELYNENKYIMEYALTITLSNYRKSLFINEFEKFRYNSEFTEKTVSWLSVPGSEFAGSVSVMLHLNEVLLLKTKSEKYYYILKDMLLNKLKSQNERYSLLNILHGYCYNRSYAGEKMFSTEIFELYRASIEGGFYKSTQDKIFDAILFSNIANSAIREKQFSWAEWFIGKYKNELPADDKEIIVCFLQSKILFEKNEFSKSLDRIKKAGSIKHIQYKVAVRNLTLMLYYELKEYDNCESFYASYRQFIRKSEKFLSHARYSRYTGFLRFYSTLLKLAVHKYELNHKPRFKNQLLKIREKLEKDTNIMERSWLLNKTEELLRPAS